MKLERAIDFTESQCRRCMTIEFYVNTCYLQTMEESNISGCSMPYLKPITFQDTILKMLNFE